MYRRLNKITQRKYSSSASKRNVAPILDTLSREQKHIVQQPVSQRQTLVIGGPGTGKTHLLAARISHLITKADVTPSSILAITFSETNARHIQSLVDVNTPLSRNDAVIKSFTSFANEILSELMPTHRSGSSSRPLSPVSQQGFLKAHLDELPLNKYHPSKNPRYLKALLDYFTRLRDSGITTEHYSAYVEKLKEAESPELETQEELCTVYSAFVELKKEHNVVFDIGDQAELMSALLEESPSLKQKFEHILIDDLQDCMVPQFELIQELGENSNIIATGDDDQSIFSFRGASKDVFQLFGATYPEANVVVLSNNYRSTSDILLSSRRLISHNPNRMEFKYGISKASKNVYERHKKDSDQVPAVHHLNFSSTTEEEEAVVEKIKEIKQNAAEEDQQEPSIAILVRNNADIGRIARKLVQKGIQTNAFGLFYENPEIDLLMNFLSAVVKPSESRDLYNLIASQAYSFPPADLAKVTEIHMKQKIPLREVLKRMSTASLTNNDYSYFSTEAMTKAKLITNDMEFYEKFLVNGTTSELVYLFMKKSNILGELLSPNRTEQANNVNKFLQLIENMEKSLKTSNPAFLVPHLQRLEDFTDSNVNLQPELDPSVVYISTIHRSRGQEFDYVFLVGATEDKIPGSIRRDFKIPIPSELMEHEELTREEHVAEERKLAYVAITRAKKQFYFTSASANTNWVNRPSRFIYEALGKLPPSSFTKTKPPEPEEDDTEDTELRLAKDIFLSPTPFTLSVKSKLSSINFQKLSTYMQCPLMYCYQYALEIPTSPTVVTSHGSAMSRLYGYYFSELSSGLDTSQTDMEEKLNEIWIDIFGDTSSASAEYSSSQSMLANFFNQKQSIDSKFIVNKPFAIDIDGVSVEGHLDRVDTLDDGVEELVQYKSSLEKGRKLIKRPKKTKDNFELLFHSWAFKYVYGHLPSKTVLKTIDRTSGVMGNVAEFSVDDEDFKQTDQLVRESISAIQEGVFHGTPNWKSCTNCPYKSSCPVAYQGKKQAE